MCGICGFNWNDKKLIREMCSLLEHRGPDQQGEFLDRSISLGHRRLSIIDLSENGRQPMHNEDNSIWLVFNGEIFNFQSLKTELEKKGHRFYSNTDSEVIIHSYEEYGENCVSYFNGFFAFAIYDSIKNKIFLTRDRLGIKPLYYTIFDKDNERKFIFSSEIKSILLCPDVKREVCLEAVDEFLTFRCNSLAKTSFKNIFKLLPAHCLTYQNGAINIRKYWGIDNINPINKPESYFTEKILQQLEESVKMRLISDVPLGAYLSGGVDSGAIVSMMAKLSSEPINTFTVGFEEKNHDETTPARILADKLKTNHTEIVVKMDASRILPKIVWHHDEPMSDATSIPIYLMAEKTKPHVTVVLTGDGGDELFLGYDQFKFIKIHQQFLRKTPVTARKAISSIISMMPPKILDFFFKYSSSLGEQGLNRSRDFISTNDYAKIYLSLVSIFDENEKINLYSKDTKDQLKDYNLVRNLENTFFRGINKKNYLDKLNYLDTSKILAEDFMMKIDKNTMAFGIEARTPLLDYNLVELAASIPPDYKLNGLNDKYIFRKAASKILPREVFQRKKSRFFVPINAWFAGELGEITKQIITEETIKKQGYFNYDQIDKIFKHFKRSPLYSARQQWSLLNFQLWHKLFIETDDFKNKNKIDKFKLDHFI